MHALFDTVITHARRPVPAAVQPHTLRAKTYMFLLDLDRLNEAGPLVSINRFNLFSFYDRDHLKFLPVVEGCSTAQRVREFLDQEGLPEPDRILLLTNLRVLGYVFNPVSFYYCYRDGKLLAVLAEVNNTFGEQHPILIDCRNRIDERGFYRYQSKKNFYVSPFLKYDTDLFFHFRDVREEQLFFIVDSGYAEGSEKEILLRATLTGKRRTYSSKALLYEFFRIPFVTLRIIAGIHWHALLLYLKKIPYYRKKETDAEIKKLQAIAKMAAPGYRR